MNERFVQLGQLPISKRQNPMFDDLIDCEKSNLKTKQEKLGFLRKTVLGPREGGLKEICNNLQSKIKEFK